MVSRRARARLLRRIPPHPLARRPLRPEGEISSLELYARDELGDEDAFVSVRPAHRHRRRHPVVLPEQRRCVAEWQYEHLHSAAFRATLPEARLIGRDALVFSRDGRVFRESALDRSPTHRPHVPRRLPRAAKVDGPHMTILTQWQDNYYHWMLDALPRLGLLPLTEKADWPIIVPEHLTGAQLASLEVVGVSRERLVPFDGTHLVAEQLCWPSHVGNTGHPPVWAASWLQERLAGRANGGADLRLYISRQSAGWRVVRNEREVCNLLRARGFTVVDPGSMPFADQLAMFSSAKIIVGAHGAGLVNMLAATNAGVVELFSRRYVNPCYFHLADALGHTYGCLICSPRSRFDLHVDLERLSRVLAHAEAVAGEKGERPPTPRSAL